MPLTHKGGKRGILYSSSSLVEGRRVIDDPIAEMNIMYIGGCHVIESKFVWQEVNSSPPSAAYMRQ